MLTLGGLHWKAAVLAARRRQRTPNDHCKNIAVSRFHPRIVVENQRRHKRVGVALLGDAQLNPPGGPRSSDGRSGSSGSWRPRASRASWAQIAAGVVDPTLALPGGVLVRGGSQGSHLGVLICPDCYTGHMGRINSAMPLVAVLALGSALPSCGSGGGRVGEMLPIWAGGMPKGVPPRPGMPEYEAHKKQLEGRNQPDAETRGRKPDAPN